jgi:hypothetical protein
MKGADVFWLAVLVLALGAGALAWFHVPTRLFGSHGGDRLAPLVASFQARGCVPIVPLSVEYVDGVIVRPIPISPGTCAVVVAAGGEGQMHVHIDLFAPWGLRVAESGPGTDAAVRWCDPPGAYRTEIRTIPYERVAFAALACRASVQ